MIQSRHTFIRAAGVLAAVASLAACAPKAAGPSAADTAKDADAIRALEDQATAAANGHDFAKFASLYVADSVLIDAGSPVLHGPAEIAKSFDDFANDKAYNFTQTIDRVEVGGDIGYALWTYDQASTDPKSHAVVHETGNGIDTLRKGPDGAWKFVATLHIPSPPAAPAPKP
jgi:uncharacterized protein (TIGR02246 family)